MVKKLLSVLGIVGILSSLVVSTAYALTDLATENEALLETLEVTQAQATIGGANMTATMSVIENYTNVTAEIVANDGTSLPLLSAPTVDVVNPPVAGYHAATVNWDGLGGTEGEFYMLRVTVEDDVADTYDTDTDTGTAITVYVALSTPAVSVASTYDPGDPATGDLDLTYTLNKAATSATVVYKDADSNTVNTYQTTTATAGANTASWTGKYDNGDDNGEFVPAGAYTVTVEATDGTSTETSAAKTVTVAYGYDLAPEIKDLVIDPEDGVFDTDDESFNVTFEIPTSSLVDARIYDASGDVVFDAEFDDEDDDSDKDEISGELEFEWDGEDQIGCLIDGGTYTMRIDAKNEYGVTSEVRTLTVTSDGAKCVSGAARIKNIDFDPTSTWDPIEEELEIAWEIDTDEFDEFKIEARQGGEKIEIYSESDPDADDGYDHDWDGLDEDGEYIDSGTWTLLFTGEDNDVIYYVEKTMKVKYDEPKIDDTFVTKSDIDPELGEGVYFVFILEDEAEVDLEVQKDGKGKVDLLEDELLKADVWYAVYWDGFDDDGDDFDYDDSFKFKLIAKSPGDKDIFDTATESIDLDEDDASSSKSNILRDMLAPPIVKQGGDVVLGFSIEEDAEVRVAIWKGSSTSGTPDFELQDYKEMKSGDHEFEWDTRDTNGNLVRTGYYSYKVFTKKDGSSSTESESGKFYVGKIGEVYGSPDAYVAPGSDDDDDDDNSSDGCGFDDVSELNPNCEAIAWAKDNGISTGNADGTFRPYSLINRVEVFALILRAFDLNLYPADGTTLGFSDVTSGAWYMTYLRTAQFYEMVNGYADGTVRPTRDVSRAELLKLIYAANQRVNGVPVTYCTFPPYTDVSMNDWFVSYVCQSKADGLLDTVLNLFRPTDAATRGEVVEALYRLMK